MATLSKRNGSDGTEVPLNPVSRVRIVRTLVMGFSIAAVFVTVCGCTSRGNEIEKRDEILDQVEKRITIKLSPIGAAETGRDGTWFDYQVELVNESDRSIWLSKTSVVDVLDYMKRRNPEGYFYNIETERGAWRDANIGITGHRTGSDEVAPRESVRFVAPVRTNYEGKALEGAAIRVSLSIFADAKDPNGRKVSSASLAFPNR